MLVLARHIDEAILIGDDVVVTVEEIHGTTVRLGIVAPRHIRVDREEVRERIESEKIELQLEADD